MAAIEIKKEGIGKKKMESVDFEALPITSKFSIKLEPSSSYDNLSDAKKRLIQTIWEQEQKRRKGRLHEGMILSAISFDSKELVGQFVPYKYYLAQLCDPALKRDLKIVPVSLCGITRSGEDIVVARRAWWVAEYPEYFELAPSGGVRLPDNEEGRIDIKVQLLEELDEEIGIDKSHVKSVKFFALIKDHKTDSVEICAEITLKPLLILSSTSEYPQVMTVPVDEIPHFVNKHVSEFVPLSLNILKLRKLIPGD